MDDLEYKSSTAKRHAASRRQQQHQQQGDGSLLPLHIGSSGSKPMLPQPPRSGQVLLPNVLQFQVRDKKDASGKRRFQVNIPRKYLIMLLLIFFIVPMLAFFYKEIHIHDDHEHYKAEKFFNVDTEDVLSHVLDFHNNNNNNNHTTAGTATTIGGTAMLGSHGEEGKSSTTGMGENGVGKLEAEGGLKSIGNMTLAKDSAVDSTSVASASGDKARMRRLAS